MQPIRTENNKAVFTSSQVAEYGSPADHGYEEYIVVEGEQDHIVPLNHFEYSTLVKKHRYSRIGRFRRVLRNLYGESSVKIEPENIVPIIGQLVTNDNPNPYTAAFKILRHYKQPQLYSHIPRLLKMNGINIMPPPTSQIFEEACNRFKMFETLFNEKSADRKYFPNLRYTALRILKSIGVENKFIPMLRTKSKEVALDALFTEMEALNASRKIVQPVAEKRALAPRKPRPEKSPEEMLKIQKRLQESEKLASKTLLKMYAKKWRIPQATNKVI